MVEQKGLPESVADLVGQFVQRRGSLSEILSLLKSDERLAANENVKTGIEDMGLLLSYLDAYEIADKVSFDLSLARGLDYYTGVIFEVVTSIPKDHDSGKNKEPRVGSIAAGGRYDNLVGMYCDRRVPCVGISFGVERIYTILEARQPKEKGKSKFVVEVDVYVVAAGRSGRLLERMAICGQLTKADVRAAFLRKSKPSMLQQFAAADTAKAPLTVIFGPDELAEGKVKLKRSTGKDASSGAEAKANKDGGQLVAREDLVTEVKKALQETSQK